MTNISAALLRVAEEEQTPNELWEEGKEVVNTAAKKHVSKRKKQKQPWQTNETLGVADERRQAKVTGDRGRWERLNKEFTKSAREDKNAYIESKCREMEKDKTNSKKAFRILKEVTGKRPVRTDVINDTEGRALTDSVDILKRWEEYCGKLYKNQDGDNDNNRLDQICDYDREPPPLRSEVEWALGNGKAPGMDDIPIELCKAAGDEGVDILWRICKLIWTKEEWPKDCCREVFIPIPKKGNLKECSNYRAISIIVHASKVLLKIIKGSIKLHYDREMAEEQAGFVEGKGTREQIVNIRIIIEKCRDQNIPLYMCFIDYAKAFDCVSHRKLWDTMEQKGFPVHIIQLVANLYKEQ